MSEQLKHPDLASMNRAELRTLIQEMSFKLKQRLENGEDIDTILEIKSLLYDRKYTWMKKIPSQF